MVTVSGRLLDFVEDPSNVAQVQVRASEVRPHGDGVMLDHPVKVDYAPSTGTVTFDAAAGTAGVIMWHAVGRSHASGSLPLIVPEGDTATLRECVEAALLADEHTLSALERLAQEIAEGVARVGTAVQVGEWATAARQSVTEAQAHAADAQRIETNLPNTIATELDTQVPPAVADALATDRAVADAAAAAVDGALASSGDTIRTITGLQRVEPEPGTAWAHMTADGLRLPLGYRADGRLDEFARQTFAEDVTSTTTVPDDPEFAHVQATTTGHILAAIRWDGSVYLPGVPDPVEPEPTPDPTPADSTGLIDLRQIERDAEYAHVAIDERGRIIQAIRWNGSIYTPGSGASGGGGIPDTEVYVRDGAILPVKTDMSVMLGWGSSTIHALADHIGPMVAPYGVTYMREAQGGERAEGTAARLGSRPALVTFPANTIPGDTAPVPVDIPNLAVKRFIKPYTVEVGGVLGDIDFSGGGFRFARAVAGDPVTIAPETPAIPTLGPAHLDKVQLISTGKNNINDPNELDIIPEVNQVVDDMYLFLTPLHRRCLMIGHFANANYSQTSTAYQRVMNMNAHLKDRYGRHYIDVHEIVTTDLLWELTGIDPTTEDRQHQARGVIPPSVQFNLGHLNTAGEAAVSQVVVQRMLTLGWY